MTGAAETNRQREQWLLALVLVVVTLAVGAPVVGHDFVNYDDPIYVTENPHVRAGLTRAGLLWAFGTTRGANWHPLTWLSHMADCQLFGLDPAGHHLTSLLLHGANVLLLFLLLARLTGALRRSAVVAALFALHPLHVESYAWVAERKDLLAAFSWLLTLFAYARYVERPGPWRYLAALGLYACGLLAKPMVVTLPVILLLCDCWPLGRLPRALPAEAPATAGPPRRLSRLLLEKVPFLLLAAAVSVVTLLVQARGGAVTSLDAMSLPARVNNALLAAAAYLVKMFWPTPLAVIYPLPPTVSVWQGAGAGIALALLTLYAVNRSRQHPWLCFGWLWYLVTLVPVIGLVQVGRQALADRYTYLPLIGLFIILAWGVPTLFPAICRRRLLPVAVTIGVLLVLAVLTRQQLGHWRTSEELFRHAAAVVPGNYVAHAYLGDALARQGRDEAARVAFVEALRIRPDDEDAHNDLGVLLARHGETAEALRHYQLALASRPDFANAHYNLAVALVGLGRNAEALLHFNAALQSDPDRADAEAGCATVLLRLGRGAEALPHFAAAVRLDPASADARYDWGVALAGEGRLPEAAAQFAAALRLRPAMAEAHYNLGVALVRLGRVGEAIGQFEAALRSRPDFAAARRSLEAARRLAGQ